MSSNCHVLNIYLTYLLRIPVFSKTRGTKRCASQPTFIKIKNGILYIVIFHEETRVKSMSKRITSDSKTSERSESKSRDSGIEKDNAPLVRREIFNMETLNILLSAIILVVLLFVVGGNLGEKDSQVSAKFTSDENSCRIFCENNPQYGDAVFGGISENGHCLCEIKIDSMPNYAKNKTLSVNLLIDQGIIIRQATLKDGVAAQALSSIETLQ